MASSRDGKQQRVPAAGPAGGRLRQEVAVPLVIVENGFRLRLEAMLASPAEADWRERTAAQDAVLPNVAVVQNPVTAPPRLYPTGGIAPAASLRAFQQARAEMIALAQRPGVAFREHTFDHPALGVLNGEQCLRTLGYHTLRHLAQMQRCGRAASQPA